VFKKTLIGFGILMFIVLGGAVIAPSFMDWNARLPQIAAQVKSITGRDLSIDGKLEVRIFPSPMVTARGVKFGNMQGGVASNMVVLDAVEVRVALLPLLSGEVQVERIILVNPVITIEKGADGRTNMDFQSNTPTTGFSKDNTKNTSSEAGKLSSGLGVRLDNVEIKNATLIYLNAATGAENRVDRLDATLRASSLQGPFEAQGQARVRGVPVSFDVSLGQIIAQRTVPVDASLKVGGATLQLSGALLGLEADPYFNGKAKVEGDNLAELLNVIRQTGTSPGVFARNFGLEATLKASASAIALSDLNIQFASAHASGMVRADFTAGTQFDVQLKAAHIDVDGILASNEQQAKSNFKSNSDQPGDNIIAPKPPVPGETKTSTPNFTFPKGVSGTVHVVVDALTVKGGLLRDLRLNAELADGELALSQLQIQAPGVTDLAVFGFVRPKDGQPEFDGSLELLTSDPQGLTNWLGIALPQGVTNRLKRISLTTKVNANTEQVMLSNINLTGDRSTITGGATVALRARPSLGVDLKLDTLDMDIYLNAGAAASTAPVGLAASPPTPILPHSTMDVLKVWSALNALNDFDANVKMRVGTLKLKGKTYTNMRTDGTLYAGNLDLRSLSLGDFEGASGNVSGSFSGFGGAVEMTNVKVGVKVANATTLAAALGIKSAPQGLGPMRLKTVLNGSVLKPRFTINVEALNGKFGAKGSFSLLPIGFGYDGTVSAQHPDAAQLLAALNLNYAPKGPLGALDIHGKLRSNGQMHVLMEVQGALGDIALEGDVKASLEGPKPNITVNLKTGPLMVDAFLPQARAAADKQAAAHTNPLLFRAALKKTQPIKIAKAIQVNPRWSRDTFDLNVLNQINADVTLLSDAIQFGDYRLDNADIHAVIKDGVMTADRVQGKLFGGLVRGTAQVRADGQPTLTTDISLSALDVGQATKQITGKKMAGGKLALTVGFKGVGFSPAELVSSLDGNGNMRISALDVKKGGSGSALSGVIGLVSAMNKLSLSASRGAEKGLADIGLSFDVAKGVATVNDFALTSGLGNGQGAGTIDLANWTIDFAGKMKVEANLLSAVLSKGRISIQEIPFSLKGALDKPSVNLMSSSVKVPGQSSKVGSPLQKMLQKVLPGLLPVQPKPQAAQKPAARQSAAQGGRLAPPPPQQGSPSTPKPGQLSPEEMIRQLMQGM